MTNWVRPIISASTGWKPEQGEGRFHMGSAIGTLIYLIFIVAIVAAYWMVFQKAGKPGWAAIIPIYNLIILLQIVQRPIWWIILFFIPFVSLIIAIIIALDLAQSFGKGAGFGLGLIFLPIIFYPILGFGDAVYSPKKAEA